MIRLSLDYARHRLGDCLIRYLTRPTRGYFCYSPNSAAHLRGVIRCGGVLLVEGDQRFSTAVKYLTQTSWSHSALYIGDELLAPGRSSNGESLDLVEADLMPGVTAVPLSKYDGFNTRICRPAGLCDADCRQVAQFMIDSIGLEYDPLGLQALQTSARGLICLH